MAQDVHPASPLQPRPQAAFFAEEVSWRSRCCCSGIGSDQARRSADSSILKEILSPTEEEEEVNFGHDGISK